MVPIGVARRKTGTVTGAKKLFTTAGKAGESKDARQLRPRL
jgi:hypothetical protein